MGLFKKFSAQQRPLADPTPPGSFETAHPGDPKLPGVAGYRGVGKLPKGAMPVMRFDYRRPDGKDE